MSTGDFLTHRKDGEINRNGANTRADFGDHIWHHGERLYEGGILYPVGANS